MASRIRDHSPTAARFVRRGRRVWVAPAVAIALLVLSAAGDEGSALPERVLAELRSAGEARAAFLREHQDWQDEKVRLELLATSISRQAERLNAAADRAEREAAELQAEMADAASRRRQLQEVEAMVDAFAERLERELAGLSDESLPGLVPPDRAAGVTDPLARLSAAAERLREAQRRSGTTGVEIVTGPLDGEDITVKLLRVGGVTAWWISLDGDRAGHATLANGELTLSPAADAADAAAIRQALAIAEGRAAPEWVLLPVRHADVRPAEDAQP